MFDSRWEQRFLSSPQIRASSGDLPVSYQMGSGGFFLESGQSLKVTSHHQNTGKRGIIFTQTIPYRTRGVRHKAAFIFHYLIQIFSMSFLHQTVELYRKHPCLTLLRSLQCKDVNFFTVLSFQLQK